MTNDQFEAHILRFTHDPSYEAGYRVGLAGPSMLRHEHVRLEPAWADGWHAGLAEAAMKAETIAEWMSRGRRTANASPSSLSELRAQAGCTRPIATAAWFSDRVASHAAVCPPGTTGIAMQMNALPKS